MMHHAYKAEDPLRVAPEIVLTDEERVELTKLTTLRLTSVRLSQRARSVLLVVS